ncbi:MAG: hypothetical protein Q9166_007574, partial [cf. Caloplaca sp. 2 TL-2023]
MNIETNFWGSGGTSGEEEEEEIAEGFYLPQKFKVPGRFVMENESVLEDSLEKMKSADVPDALIKADAFALT